MYTVRTGGKNTKSERGSFVTDYLYCDDCVEAANTVLVGQGKHLCSLTIPSWQGGGKELPVIAGKIGGLYGGEEINTFELELIPKLEPLLCHNLRIAVLADNGKERLLIAHGRKKHNE